MADEDEVVVASEIDDESEFDAAFEEIAEARDSDPTEIVDEEVPVEDDVSDDAADDASLAVASFLRVRRFAGDARARAEAPSTPGSAKMFAGAS